MRATLARLRSSRGWGSTLPHVHRSRKSRFDRNGHLEVKLALFSASRTEKPRLFMYVQAVSIEFNAWDRSACSVRELWRQLSSKRLRAANPKCEVKAEMVDAATAPRMQLKFVDGSDLSFPDTSKHTCNEILSEIYQRASDLDFEYATQGKALELEQ